MNFLRCTGLVLRKDLLLELRRRETLGSLLYFSFLVTVLLSFSLQGQGLSLERLLPPLFFALLLFTSTLFLNRLFEAEREGGALLLLRGGSYPRGALFLGKWGAQLFFLGLLAALQLAAFFVFLDLPLGGTAALKVLGVLLAALAGLSACGTVFAAMMIQARFRDLLLPLLLFPVSLPLLLPSIRLLQAALQGRPLGEGPWLSLLLGFDLMVLGLALALFETVFEGGRE